MANFSAVILRATLWGIVCLFFQNAYGQLPSTNQEFVENQIYSIFDSLLSASSVSSQEIRFETGNISAGKDIFLQSVFYRVCTDRSLPVKTDSAKTVFFVERFDLFIVYDEKMPNMMGFGGGYTRRIDLLLGGWLKEHRIYPFSVHLVHGDTINENMYAESTNSPYPFLRGKIDESTNWTKYLEPAVVILSAAALIYLLFTLRTS